MAQLLNGKEVTAIELKYLGTTYKEIAIKTDLSEQTIKDWFATGGNLESEYDKYARDINKRRAEKVMDEFSESDKNILTVTTNAMRSVGKRIQDGDLDLSMNDYDKAWKIQRVMLGKSTDVRTQNMNFDQGEMDTQAQGLKDLINREIKRKKEEDEAKAKDKPEEKPEDKKE